MKGFYKKKEITTPKRKKTNFRKISGCESCKQYHKCENGKFGVSGSGSNGILIIDDMVSIQEERGQGDFSGIDAKYLKSCLGELGVKLEECYYMHSMRCYAGGKKENISTAMRNGCKTLFWKDIKSLNPDKSFRGRAYKNALRG
jgi:uracil-DNA glycosylase